MKKLLLSFVMVLCMVIALLPAGIIPAYAADSSYSAQFSYNGKQYSAGGITGTQEIQLSTILTPLEINGTVTAASVSEGQGMTVTTTAITLTKAFGTGWLKVTAGGTEHQITITSTPDSISVVLYGTLFFDKNGGSGIMDGQPVQEYTQTVLPDCAFTSPDGYEFDQWEINGARYNAGATYTFGQTTTAKAIWKLREGVHSITAVYNNSDGDVVVSPTMAAADEQVTVTVQPVAGKAVESISYSYGSTAGQDLSGGEGGVYTFSMPGENTTVSVTFKGATKEPIAYVDEDGNSKNCTDYSYIRSTDTAWSGWVVASQNLTLDSRVTVSGTVNLILMDGKTLTVTGGIGVGKNTTLNIYAQSGNSGKLIAGSRNNSYYAGIGAGAGTMTTSHYGNITINGGVIEAEGGSWSAGIGGSYRNDDSGVIVIRGNANVTAYGTENAAAIGGGHSGSGGKITIQGNPVVTATGRNNDSAGIGGGLSGSFSQINISGGTVTATGGNMANAIGSGRGQAGGTISITGGNVTATATGSWGAGIGSQCDSITIGGNAVVNATGASRGAGIGGCNQKPGGKITIADHANVTAVGGAYAAGIGTGYNAVADGETAISITGGTVNASVATSNSAAAIGSGNNARGKTTISISNGSVTASGSSIYSVGIGGGNSGASGEEIFVNITGGTVNANGRAGIGTANASNANLTINISGGTVTARGAIDGSNKCAAIGQGNNSNSVTEINITGGIVRALGTGTGIGSGTNSKQTPVIKLGYTDVTKDNMEITAIDYNGTVTLNNSFKYQDGTGAVTTPITANKTIVPSDSTAHTHSFTYSVDGNTITATCTNSDNQCNLTNHKATLTIGEPDGKTSMVYDGTAKVAVLTGDTDVLTADVVYKKGDTVLPAAPSDAGSYTASISLGGTTTNVSYDITKKPVTFASITAKDKVYDGTTKASCSIGTGVNGAISGDNVSAKVSSGLANFDTPGVGVNKAVTFTNWKLEGSSKDNYEMVQPDPQYRTITPRVITITAKAQTVPQGGVVTSSPEQVEVTDGTLVEGQQISEITLTGDTSTITTNGSITPSAVKIQDASNNDVTANYVVNYTAGTLTVEEASPHTHEFNYSATGNNITATCANSDSNCLLPDQKAVLTINAPTELTYDGTAKAATITGNTAVLGTPTITYAKTGDTSFTGEPKDVGAYTASITLTGVKTSAGENQSVTASVEYTITSKSVTITGLSASEKVYDGTAEATVTGTATIDGKIDSDDVSVVAGTAAFADADFGTGKAVTFSGYSLTGGAAGNYTLSAQPADVTANITKRPITIKAADQSVELGGSIATGKEKVSITSGTLADDQTLTGVTLAPSSTAVVTDNGSITPSNAVIKNASDNEVTTNYNITYTPGTLTVTAIAETKPEATFTATGADTGTISGLVSGGQYTVTGAKPTTFTASGAEQALTEVSAGTLRIVRKGNGTSTADSEAQEISVTKPDAPSSVNATDCTSSDNSDGKLTGVTAAMEYKKSDATEWTTGDGNDITGLVPGTYYVRVKASDTALASGNLELAILAYAASGQVAAPTFSPAAGTYTSEQTVTISCTESDATIYYTLDGTEPTTSGTAYNTSITLNTTTTIKAIAAKNGKTNSSIAEATYTFVAPTYDVTVVNGTSDKTSASAGDAVTITANTPPSRKQFKEWTGTDGLTFTSGSASTAEATFTMPANAVTVEATYEDIPTYTLAVASPTFEEVNEGYSQPVAKVITITSTGNSDATISEVALSGSGKDAFILTDGTASVTAGGNNESYKIQPKSGLSAGTYTATITVTYNDGANAEANVSFKVKAIGTVATPTYTPDEGTYSTAQSVTITCSTNGAVIYYTINGSEPTIESILYNGVISVSSTTTIKAIAVKEGMSDSEIASATYTITNADPPSPSANYTVTVLNGTGGGSYKENEIVTVSANEAPDGKEFDKWTSEDEVSFYDAYSESTSFTMPAKDVVVTATYKDKNTVPVITLDPKEKTGLIYNGKDQALVSEGTASGGHIVYSLSENGVFSDAVPSGRIAKTYKVYYKAVGDDGHTESKMEHVEVVIDRAKVKVKADDKSKTEGEDEPEYTVAITGLVNGESESLISYEVSREPGEDVGQYIIMPRGGNIQGNYLVEYESGKLIISERKDSSSSSSDKGSSSSSEKDSISSSSDKDSSSSSEKDSSSSSSYKDSSSSVKDVVSVTTEIVDGQEVKSITFNNDVAVKQKVDASSYLGTHKKYVVYPKGCAKVDKKKKLINVKKAGTITITAYDKADKQWIAKEVIHITADKPVVKQKTINASAGGQVIDGADNIDDGNLIPARWVSSKPSVASVDEKTGLITPLANGKAIITAYYGEGKNAAKVKFKVKVEK